MGSKPCNQLDAQLWGASDATREEGTSGFGTDLGSALRAAAPRTWTATPLEAHLSGSRFCRRASDTNQQTPTGSEMGSQVPIVTHRPLSEYAEARMLRVARRAIRQFYRENVFLHKGQVITSEAQLAVIFGQRVVDKVRATITATHCRRPKDTEKKHLARSHEHFIDGSARPLHAVLFKRARWKLPSRAWSTSLIRPGRLRLTLKHFNRHSLHAAGLQETRISGDRAEFTSTLDLFDDNSPWYHVLHRSTSALVSLSAAPPRATGAGSSFVQGRPTRRKISTKC